MNPRTRSFAPRLGLVLAVAVGLWLGAAPAEARRLTKKLERKFPVGLFCPLDVRVTDTEGDVVLEFVADGPAAQITFRVPNCLTDCGDVLDWSAHRLDNLLVVERSVFDANTVVTPNFDFCYVDNFDAPAFDFTAATPLFLDRFDTDAGGWSGPFAGFRDDNSGNGGFGPPSAPGDPTDGSGQNSGGGLALGLFADGPVVPAATKTVVGLTPGETYVIHGWWYTNNLDTLDIEIDTDPPEWTSTGIGFVPRQTGVDVAGPSFGLLGGNGSFVAPLPVEDGATLRALTVHGRDDGGAADLTARLLRLERADGAVPETIAEVSTQGSQAQPASPGVSVPDADLATVDLRFFDYYTELSMGADVLAHGLRVAIQPPGAPPASERVNIAAAAFVAAADSVDSRVLSSGRLVGPGRFVAPVELTHGAVVQALTLVAVDDDLATEARARLIRLPVAATGGTTMAQASSSGIGASVREFVQGTIATPTVDNGGFYYLVELALYGPQLVHGVSVDASVGPGGGPRSVAGGGFLPADSTLDQRAQVADALAGTGRFVASVSLPDGATVAGMRAHVLDDDPGGAVTVRLQRVDVDEVALNPATIASVATTSDDPAVQSIEVAVDETVVADAAYYYVELELNGNGLGANGVQLDVLLPCVDSDEDGRVDCTTCAAVEGQLCGDCDDENPDAVLAAGNPGDLQFGAGAPAAMVWTVGSESDGTHVYAGTLDPGFNDDAACLEAAVAGSSYTPIDPPAPGTGFYFLLTGFNACGETDAGSASDGQPRGFSTCETGGNRADTSGR